MVSKNTKEVRDMVLKALGNGHSRKAAASYAGLCEDTLYSWVKESTAFRAACLTAEAKFERAVEGIVTGYLIHARKQADNAPELLTRDQFDRAMTILERLNPQKWRETKEVLFKGDPLISVKNEQHTHYTTIQQLESSDAESVSIARNLAVRLQSAAVSTPLGVGCNGQPVALPEALGHTGQATGSNGNGDITSPTVDGNDAATPR